jgi:hypothetical protein
MNAAPCWSPFWPVRAATPSAARPKPYVNCKHTGDEGRSGSYGGKERVLGYLRERRSGIMTGAGANLLRQLLTGRRVAVHEARHRRRTFPLQPRKDAMAAMPSNVGSGRTRYASVPQYISVLCNNSLRSGARPMKRKHCTHTIRGGEDAVSNHDGSRRAAILGYRFPKSGGANAEAWAPGLSKDKPHTPCRVSITLKYLARLPLPKRVLNSPTMVTVTIGKSYFEALLRR